MRNSRLRRPFLFESPVMNLVRWSAFSTMLLFGVILSGCSATTDGPDVCFERANLLRERGQYDEAIRQYDLAAQHEDFAGSPALLFHRASCYEALQLPEKALADYAACLEADPGHLEARNQRGVVLAGLQRFEEAAAEFSLLLEVAPDYVLALRNRGLCFHDLQRYDEALRNYDQALKLNPEDAETWFQRGNVYLQTGRLEAAASDYQQAIDRDDRHAKAWMNLGVARYQMGQSEQGMAHLKHAQQLDSNIVVPEIDWLESAPATEVVMARPVLQQDSDPWVGCLAFVASHLSAADVTDLTTLAEAPLHRCAKLSGRWREQPVTIYVALAETVDVRRIVLPELNGVTEGNSAWLLVVGPRETADDAEPAFKVMREIRDWRPSSDQQQPVLTRVRIPD